MYRMLYMKMVERVYYFVVKGTRPEYRNMSYKTFKQYIKNYENSYYTWFKDNYLDQTQLHFKQGRITPLVIQGQIVKDDIQWDGSDPDDAIVFMLGIDNWNGDLGDYLRSDKDSAELLEALGDKKHPRYKEISKFFLQCKKIASASQKKFFKDQIQYLFENDDAFSRFKWALENNLNFLSATTQQAIDEAQQNPASPLRAPPPPQQAPRTPERVPPPPEVPELNQEQIQRLRQLEEEATEVPELNQEQIQRLRQLEEEANQAPLPPDNSEDEDFMA